MPCTKTRNGETKPPKRNETKRNCSEIFNFATVYCQKFKRLCGTLFKRTLNRGVWVLPTSPARSLVSVKVVKFGLS